MAENESTPFDAAAFQEAVNSGDMVKALVALREYLSLRIQVAGSRDIAGISKEIRDINERLDELRNADDDGPVENLRLEARKRIAEREKYLEAWMARAKDSDQSFSSGL